MIQVKTLQGIFDEYKIMKMPDYMDIDIEGLEWEVLSCYDLKGRGPKILTMEVSQNKEKLITLMEDAGYFLYLKIGINYTNYTWIKNDYKEIIMRG